MSQAGKIKQAGGAAGPILTLTGNTGGAVVPVAGNINIVNPNPYGTTYGQGKIVGNLSPATLSVQPYITAVVQTVDATANVPLWTLPITASSGVTFFAILNGAISDYSGGLTAFVSGGVLRAAVGAPQEIGSSTITQDVTGGFTGTVDVILSGNNLQIVVTGVAATIINWSALIYFVNQ